MAGKKKAKASKHTTPTPPATATPIAPPTSTPMPNPSSSALPLARYTSLLGTQSLLLLFTAFYLPRSTTTLLGTSFLPSPESSLDRPQHPFLEALTANPPLTMGWLCLGVATVEAWWAGYMRVWAKSLGVETAEESMEVRAVLNRTRGKALRGALLALFMTVPPIYLVLVLFGAPLTSCVPQTLLLSTVLALLTVFTPVYSLGLPSLTSDTASSALTRFNYIRLFSELSARSHLDRALLHPILGTIVGCWLGAIPLALDWDRPWQAWPLLPAYFAIFGHVIGSAVSLGTSVVLTLAAYDQYDSAHHAHKPKTVVSKKHAKTD